MQGLISTRIVLWSIVVGLTVLGWSGRAADAQSFDCRKARSANEKAICSDRELGALDEQMSGLYLENKRRLGVGKKTAAVKKFIDQQRAWLKSVSLCNGNTACLKNGYQRRIGELTSIDEREARTAPVAREVKYESCEAEQKALEQIAQGFRFNAELTDPHIGGQLRVEWSLADRFPLKHAVYLMMTLPEEVRFEGGPLMALPGGQRAPLSIAFGKEYMRAFVPLYLPGTPLKGRFDVKFYRSGPAKLRGALVTRTGCGERILRMLDGRRFEIISGRPEIVVQDPYALASPPVVQNMHEVQGGERRDQRGVGRVKKTGSTSVAIVDAKPSSVVISNSGRYRLETYENSYKVFDTATGALIVDRAGRKPNFTPGSRFIAAQITESELDQRGHSEVFDLVAQKVIPHLGRGDTLAWAHGDAFLIRASYSRAAGNWLEIVPTLIDAPRQDNSEFAFTDEQNHWKLAIGALTHKLEMPWNRIQFSIDLNNGVYILRNVPAFNNDKSKPFEFQEIATGYNPSCRQLNFRTRYGSGSERVCLSGRRLLDVLKSQYAISPIGLPKHWDIETGIKFSHLLNVRSEAWGNEHPKPTSLIVTHQKQNLGQGGVDTQVTVDRSDWPVVSRGQEDIDFGSLADRLGFFGIDLAPTSPGNLLSEKVKAGQYTFRNRYKPSLSAIVNEIERAAPALKRNFAKNGKQVELRAKVYFNWKKERAWSEWSLNDQNRAIVSGFWRWQVGGNKYWLIQTLSIEGSGGFGDGNLFLLGSGFKTGGKLIDLKDIFGNPEDLDDYGDTDRATRVNPVIVDGRYLILGRIVNEKIAVYDLQRNKRVGLVPKMQFPNLLQSLGLSKDARNIIQFNKDGRFFVYAMASGRLVLFGQTVDDEIVIYDQFGYYDASYEGAHFVKLHFPGEAGLYGFQQFASKLHRPDLIKKRLMGEGGRLPIPVLSPPPSLIMTNEKSERPGSLRIRLRMRAVNGLRKVRLYQDGVLDRELTLDGRNADTMIDVERSGDARYLTAQVIDTKGFVSQPVAIRFEGKAQNKGRLFLLAIGVDDYDDPGLRPLAYAARDAATLTTALERNWSHYYSHIAPVQVERGEQTVEGIKRKLHELVAKASKGDTIVLFQAGHGDKTDDGRFYLALKDTRVDDLEHSALAWADVADILTRSKARVVVLLDACHAGQAGAEAFAENDGAVGELVHDTKVPILVLAASKGRQVSREDPQLKGGIFTRGLERVLAGDPDRYDLNKNGSIEISELYVGVKSFVMKKTNGLQTPWLARKDLIGDFTLF